MAKKSKKATARKKKPAEPRKAAAPRAAVRTGKKGLLLVTSGDLPRVYKALHAAAAAETDDAEKAALQKLVARAKDRM